MIKQIVNRRKKMLSDLLFNRTVVPDLEKSMNAYSMRQKVLANNVANVMTPGYRAQKVSFEEEYRQMLNPPTTLRMTRTHESHQQVAQKTFRQVQPRVEFKDSPINDTGLNNVDIDREMAEMAENSLRYEMSTKLIHKRFANLKSAVRGR
jgi:flagellar basal-body rod protein FlgB